MLTSFIIPHKGREAMLIATLESVLRQDVGERRIEILVITQNAELALGELAARPELRVFHRPAGDTIAMLRNFGARQAGGHYLAFLDADIELAPTWLSVVERELLASPKRALVSVAQHCREDAPRLEKLRTVLSNLVIDAPVAFLPGRNLFLRRTTFDEVGGFPPALITCEDYYFTDRVAQLGELYYSGRSRYVHLGEDKDYGGLFRKEIWRGRSNLLSLAGRRVPPRELPSLGVPLWVAAFVLATLVGLLATRPLLAALCLALALVPVLLYALRLTRLARGRLRFTETLAFYTVYFPARALGTVSGALAAALHYLRRTTLAVREGR